MMWFWICWAAYAAVGFLLLPGFARDSYEKQMTTWHYQSKRESLHTGIFLGWMKSWIWPVWLMVGIVTNIITAEERAELEEMNRQKSVAEARRIIEEDAAKQQREWERRFRE